MIERCARRMRSASAALAAFALALAACRQVPPTPEALLTSADRTSAERARSLAASGTRTLVLRAEERDAEDALARSASAVRAAGLRLGYWIEVARSPALASEHPAWMASLQAHEEWRAQRPAAPTARAGEVVKVWPWIPILTREGFEAQLARVERLLAALPPADEIYLNGLQGAPSACGCGHPLCRWASDYFFPTAQRAERISSGAALEPDAAARFAEQVSARAKGAQVIPVWVAECAEDDALCHGVPCFEGRCWPALAEQWAPVVQRFERLAVFVPSRSVGLACDSSRVERELAALARIERSGAPSVAVDRSRFVAVVEGPIDAEEAHLVSEVELEQGWEPHLWRP